MTAASFAAITPGNAAVVTGGASGVGLAAARAFAARGMRVAIPDRPGTALDAAAASVEGASTSSELRARSLATVPAQSSATIHRRRLRTRNVCPLSRRVGVQALG